MKLIPDTDARNAAVYSAWRSAKGLSEREQKAQSKFDDDRFVLVRDVPVFSEHSRSRTLRNPDGSPKIDDDGQPVQKTETYGLDELIKVCDRCNYRIDDTGNFAILSEGHTPTIDQVESGVKPPPTLGFAGPYRLGMIGNKNPRWAIFEDERYYRDQAEKAERLPTRSPEVWLKPEMADRFMDPIAMLGAETPWLDQGIRFARLESGEQVEKYAASMAGADTCFVPELVGPKEKARYEEPEAPGAEPTEKAMALEPEDVKTIVDAVMATDVMQWCKAKMISEANKPEESPATPAAPVEPNAQPEAPQAPPAGMEAEAPADPSEPDAPAPGAGDEPPPAPASDTGEPDEPDGGDPEKKEKYAMALQNVGEKARYARIERENAELKQRVSKIENDKREAERYSKLNELRRDYALDLEKEKARVKTMTDEQFVSHLECIVENYSRIPVGAGLYVPDSIESRESHEQQERYSREVAQKAMDRVTEERAKGNHGYTYEAARMAVRAEMDGKKAG